MKDVKIKICGITNLEDARAAVEAGADYLGFILYPPSKRTVDAATTRAIVAALREEGVAGDGALRFVGVFVNESAATMAELLDRCGLDMAQLSGDEPPALVGDPQSPLYGRSYKALRPLSLAEAEAEAEWYLPPEPPSDAPTLLLDAHHPRLYGGTGQQADWSVAASLARTISGFVLAGGLTPENVAEAVRRVQPFAVDVASGVETLPGRKDHEKVRAFIVNAHQSIKESDE